MKRLLAVLLAFVLAFTMSMPILATEEIPPEDPGSAEPMPPTLFAKVVDVVGTLVVGILASPLILLCAVIFFGAFAVPAIVLSPVFLFNWIGGLLK